ncbi:hypothetical protein TrVE_jg9701 [Triparma verrucosa]|uniref:Protein kinase domain-containing protein n=1 Tax=Triparma verrucosa TaxID=1606542 RepID=A0A9W7FCL2_9STRA|nr:hypothetical protein TrVE_jg9701 [Triparma verrucosa]
MVKAHDSVGGLRSGQYKTDPCEKFYKFGRTLGKGSFATVKIATCVTDGTTWAIKIIDKKALNDEDREALQVECDTMMKVDHDNIVRLKEVFDNESKFYMVLEVCAGGELFDRIVEMEHYSEKEACHAFAQMTEAVGHCHKLNIVHRDLKPENLLYEGEMPNMNLKLADFGLAQMLSPMKHLHTACGTPGYVAPEILKGKDYGKEVDMWSLGVILYILLCGFPPFYEEHTPELFKVIKRGEYDFPSPYWDEVGDSAKDLINKLLVVEPSQRYTAAQVFSHPWMQSENHTKTGGALIHFQGNLKRYNAKRKFKGAIEGVMMANMLKRMLQVRRSSVVGGDVVDGVKKEIGGEGGNNVEEVDTTKETTGGEAPKVKEVVEGGKEVVEGEKIVVEGEGEGEGEGDRTATKTGETTTTPAA